MKKLDQHWLTQGLIDFEYKKYMLMSYFQEVSKSFGRVRLYPALSDLVFHYQNLITVKENKQLMYENFPKEISKADFKKLTLVYKELIMDDKIMTELEDILSFAIPEFKKYLEEGKDIYQYIEQNMEISPIGITPLRNEEGYVFLLQPDARDTNVYEYQVSIFESAKERYRGIHMKHVESMRKSLGATYETLKIDLIRRYTKLPNPATYLIESRVRCPVEETLLPVAKRLLMKHIGTMAA
jgi:hypothetical protein